MKKIQNILAACDRSEYSPYVIVRAGQLSDALGAGLTIVNVINQMDVDAFNRVMRRNIYSGKRMESDTYIREEKEGRIVELKELIKNAGFNGFIPKIVIRTGIPFHEILKTIGQEDSDLLVIGTKGRGSVRGILLGSTAEKLFRHCPIPLLSLRMPKVRTEETNKLTVSEFNYNYR